ncbi:MAG: hypothetical protein HY283_09360 [Nitrospirae bacterium]|nr:hypothetical protein [Nitrospirota bacterium]
MNKIKSFAFITVLLLLLLTPYSLRLTPVVLRAQPLSEINTEWLERQEKALQWGRDPFALPGQPSGAGVAADGEFHLSAIIYRAGRGVAIINNKILRQGDMVEGRRITEILPDRVVLQGATGEKELRVNKFVLGR